MSSDLPSYSKRLARMMAAFVPFAARSRAWIKDQLSVISVGASDAEMNAAIALARSTLPKFWASYAAPKPSETGHCLKVRFAHSADDGFEHIWVADVQKIADDRYSGRFGNDPQSLPGKRAGDVAEFEEADITDWMSLRNGKVVGCETIRPLLKHMTKAEADASRARMESP